VGRNGFGNTNLEEPSRAHLGVFGFGSDLVRYAGSRSFLEDRDRAVNTVSTVEIQ
jgi:hypothetical protein